MQAPVPWVYLGSYRLQALFYLPLQGPLDFTLSHQGPLFYCALSRAPLFLCPVTGPIVLLCPVTGPIVLLFPVTGPLMMLTVYTQSVTATYVLLISANTAVTSHLPIGVISDSKIHRLRE